MSHCLRTFEWALSLLACLASLSGCGPDGASVSGQVTLDGSPLDDATISFIPTAAGQRQAAWATIENGHYTIPASNGLGTGQFRVEIRALRAIGQQANPNDPTLVNAKEAVPSRYNSKSELVADIKPRANTASFELKSK
jgi:predicted phage tail protein